MEMREQVSRSLFFLHKVTVDSQCLGYFVALHLAVSAGNVPVIETLVRTAHLAIVSDGPTAFFDH